MSAPRADDDDAWPALPYADWRPTYTTLHMWTQVVGKVKLELTPFLNEWWNVAFALTARGLSTATIPFGQRLFQVDGRSRRMPLVVRSVAESLGSEVKITLQPVEVDDAIPFADDREHAHYDPLYVSRCWPGNDKLAEPAFVAYTYPEPPGCSVGTPRPA